MYSLKNKATISPRLSRIYYDRRCQLRHRPPQHADILSAYVSLFSCYFSMPEIRPPIQYHYLIHYRFIITDFINISQYITGPQIPRAISSTSQNELYSRRRFPTMATRLLYIRATMQSICMHQRIMVSTYIDDIHLLRILSLLSI